MYIRPFYPMAANVRCAVGVLDLWTGLYISGSKYLYALVSLVDLVDL